MRDISEATAPSAIVKNVLEADLQRQCVSWYKSRGEGYWARKFSSQSQRSVPDYLFASPTVRMPYLRAARIKFAVEFKKPGTKAKLIEKYNVSVMSTEAQYEEQQLMKAAGWIVFECDNFEAFKAYVLQIEGNQGAC